MVSEAAAFVSKKHPDTRTEENATSLVKFLSLTHSLLYIILVENFPILCRARRELEQTSFADCRPCLMWNTSIYKCFKIHPFSVILQKIHILPKTHYCLPCGPAKAKPGPNGEDVV